MSSRTSVHTLRRNDPQPSTSAGAATTELPVELKTHGHVFEDNEVVEDHTENYATSTFKQQRLCSWQPTVVPGVASSTLIILAILFIPIGISIWHFSNNIQEKTVPYTDCKSDTFKTPCCEFMGKNGPEIGKECKCTVPFKLEHNFTGPVFMFYKLTSFYQNHRRYLKSRDDAQLFGGTGPVKFGGTCKPFTNESDKPYWPCGTNARSMFQDGIKLYHNISTGKSIEIKLMSDNIAWPTDKTSKFKNPENWNTTTFKNNHVKPKAWIMGPWDQDVNGENFNGLENEDLMVWMRTSAFPDFRKLYRKIGGDYKNGLPKGDYYLMIKYTFPVKNFHGTKSIILSTTSILGGKNKFLGIAFLIIGILSLCMGLFFLGVKLIQTRLNPRVGIMDARPYQTPTVRI